MTKIYYKEGKTFCITETGRLIIYPETESLTPEQLFEEECRIVDGELTDEYSKGLELICDCLRDPSMIDFEITHDFKGFENFFDKYISYLFISGHTLGLDFDLLMYKTDYSYQYIEAYMIYLFGKYETETINFLLEEGLI